MKKFILFLFLVAVVATTITAMPKTASACWEWATTQCPPGPY
jgi:hypothetical protein